MMLLPASKAMRRPEAKAALDKDLNKLKNFPAWDLKKVKPQADVAQEARKNNVRVHSAYLVGLCHLRHSDCRG